jgi:diacylglycerol kinase
MNGLLKSFRYAGNGILLALKERNFRIHILIFAMVIVLGFYFKITSSEWLVILLISALVLTLEMVNSSIERTCDLYSKENNDVIRKIKDIAAGAVLVSAVFAVVIGIIIFRKYIFV